jgi:hypothetical protein
VEKFEHTGPYRSLSTRFHTSTITAPPPSSFKLSGCERQIIIKQILTLFLFFFLNGKLDFNFFFKEERTYIFFKMRPSFDFLFKQKINSMEQNV